MEDEHRGSYYDQPSYTMVPNKLLDFDMAELSCCEMKVLLYVVRHTLGYGKTTDELSYKQIMYGITRHDGARVDRGTGLRSRSSVAAALASLEGRGCLERDHALSHAGDPDKTHFRLSVQQCDGPSAGAGRRRGVVQKMDYPSPKNGLGVVQKMDQGVVQKMDRGSPKNGPTKENVQKKTDQKKTKHVCAAAEPQRARAALDMVATQDQAEAPDARRLALKLSGEVLDCPTVSGARLERYEAFCAGLLDQGYATQDLGLWMDWMSSGVRYWAGKARLWTERAMLGDLESWESDGRPGAGAGRAADGTDGSRRASLSRDPPRAQPSEAAEEAPPTEPNPIWRAALAELRQIVTPENYRRWLEPTRVREAADDHLTVEVGEERQVHWLERKLGARIKRALAGQGKPDLRVEYVVAPALAGAARA